MKYFEIEFSDGYSIACKGERIPSIEEANIFYAADAKERGAIISVTEIGLDEATSFFDTSNIDNWPVFR